MKKILLLFTVLLLTAGGGQLWAKEYTVMFDNGATQSTAGWFTIAGSTSYQDNYTGTYGGHTYARGLKMQQDNDISFTTVARSTVTIVQCISRTSDNNGYLKFDGTTLTDGDITATQENVYIEFTKSDVAAGTHHITRTNQTGLFFVKVVEEDLVMSMNPDDRYYADAAYVGTTFTYCGEYTFRIKVNLNQDMADSDFNTSYFSVISSNNSVIDVTGYSVWKAGSSNRVYYQVTTKGTGTATLTFSYNGGGSIKNSASCSQEYTLTAPSFAVFNTSSPSYPFTWDFANNDWTSSKIQTKNTSSTWTWTTDNAVAKSDGTIAADNGIDMIKGLSFSSTAGTTPRLDWTNKVLDLAASSTITTPSLSVGQIITLTSSGTFAAPSNTTQVGHNTFRVTTAGAITLTVPSGGCWLQSIKISSAGQATYETTADGVFQFTSHGSIDGGTVIKDVPGIELTIGVAGNTYTVDNAKANNNDHLTNSVECADTYLFTPKVNGYLTVNVWSGENNVVLGADGNTDPTKGYAYINKDFPKNEEFSKPLLVGHTYVMHRGTVYLHSFSFRPAFLTPDNTAEQTTAYEAYSSDTSFPMMVSGYTSGVSFTSSNTDVATVDANTGWPTYKAAGTTTITGTVTSPNSSVNNKTATYTLEFKNPDQSSTLAFATPSPSAIDYITYGADISGHSTFTNAITSSSPADALNGATITYSSSDTSIATVDASGNLSIFNNGTVTITATMAAHGKYLQVTQSYTLTINATVDSEMRLQTTSTSASPIEIPFGNSIINKGVVWAYEGTEWVKHEEAWVGYEPANTTLISVENDPDNVKNQGKVNLLDMSDTDAENIVAIRVWSPAYKQYKAAETTYYVKIVQNTSLALTFAPVNSGFVNVSSTITPYLGMSSVLADKIGSLTAVSSDNAIATITYDLTSTWQLSNGYVHKILPTMSGVAEGTCEITVTLSDTKYYKGTETKYYLTVNAVGTCNFSWNDGDTPEYKVFEGDFMLMPLINGNSNSNSNYSDHTNNKYLYRVTPKNSSPSSLSDFTLEYNTEDYRKLEGIPDFDILTENKSAVSDKALIFNCKGEGGRTGEKPDTLMIYALPLGATEAQTVYIRAYEPANHLIYRDAKLTIMPKSSLTSQHDADANSVTYPYTWDFTKDFDASVINNVSNDKVYWTPKKNSSGTYYAGGGFFNIKSYAYPKDKTYDSKNTNIYYQDFVANGTTIPQFKGLMVSINGTSSWGNKVERLQITPQAGNGNSHVFFNGGYHELILPDVLESKILPDNFKVIVKVKSSGSGKVTCIQGPSSDERSFGSNSTIIAFNATKTGGQILLRFSNAHVYWIACSTEEKTLNYPKTITYGGNSVTTGVTYAANTYSYNQDLDIVKSDEANGVTAYYASSFTVGKAAAATGETEFAVTMTPANSLEYVKANTGLLLKKEASGDAAQTVSCYMIANPRNVESYNAYEKIDGGTVKNYLKGTGANSATVTGWEDGKTNFLMAYAYKYYTNLSDPSSAQGDYRFDRNWSFYPAMGNVTVPAQRAYLQVPQNVYVDREGNIVEMPSGSRSHRSGDTAEAPATKAMLSIVFDDEPHGGDSGETTGINTVSERNIDSDAWFTLQGVRVNAPAKGGIYIHKGRKVVVK